jgi:hypothetical protein
VSNTRRFIERLGRLQPELLGALIVCDEIVWLLMWLGAYGRHTASIAMIAVDAPIVLLAALAIFAPEPDGPCATASR